MENKTCYILMEIGYGDFDIQNETPILVSFDKSLLSEMVKNRDSEREKTFDENTGEYDLPKYEIVRCKFQ